MKRILTLCLLLSQIAFYSQEVNSQLNTCGSEAILQKQLKDHPEMAEKMAAFEKSLQTRALTNKTSPTLYRIPVVVHVMHKGEAVGVGTNLSNDVIIAKMKAINEQFRKIPGSTGDGEGADMEIEFVLAVKDPQGNQTSGIVHYDMTGQTAYLNYGINNKNTNGISEANLKALSFWDSNIYYNIWIVSEVDNNNGENGIIGAAQPATAHGTALDGFYACSSSFKNPLSRLETHELGHAFLLYHTFQGDVSGTGTLICPPNDDPATDGDLISDTAPHKRALNTTGDCSATSNDCYPDNTDLSYLHNYMNYTLDGCRNMFTAGQKTRAIAVFNYYRSSFKSPTSTDKLKPVAAPIAGFTPSQPIIVMVGSSMQFSDASIGAPNNYLNYYNAPGMTFKWNVTNGTETLTSTDQNPIFNFTTEGIYHITHEVNNGLGTNALTTNNIIYVVAASPELPPTTLTSTNSGSYSINNVSLNTIEKTIIPTINTVYADYINTDNTLLISGNTYELNFNTVAGNPYYESFVGYVDWDGNGIFDESERLGIGQSSPNTSTPRSVDLTVPANCAKNKLLRLRLSANANYQITNAMINGKSPFFIGDTKDFGIYVIDTQALGTTDNELKNINFYPNPVKDVLNISNIDNIEKVEIYNLMGQLLISEKQNATNIQMNLSQLSRGTYLASVYANGKKSTIKVLKN